ncbi:MAG: serine/threonine-protein kinase [Rhodanobacteraceae bacterium]
MTHDATTAPRETPGAAALLLFERSLDRPADERRAFIATASGDDPSLRDAALALLDAHSASEGFLDPPTLPAREIGAYRLIAPIGAGGMGQVWLGERRDGAYEQKVAIKVLASLLGDPEALRRAEAERQFLAWLDHPNIARVLDGGTTPEGQPYVVMEYVDGKRIDTWCRDAGVDPATRVRLVLQVLDAIDAAHRALIIHRDIKPANVLVTGDGVVKLLDFGIAKSLDGRIGARATRTGFAPMTPEYASPEQLTGKLLTTASDVYALGLLLYELLCGSVANDASGRTVAELAHEISLKSPTRPSQRIDASALSIEARTATEWRKRIAGDLDRVVLKALAPEPQRRYASARAFADDLARWLEHRPVLARSGGVGYRLARFVQRNSLAVAASAAALAALTIGLGFAAVQARRAAEEGERAMRANRFLTSMIARADPYYGGKPPLLVDALDRAVLEIPQELQGQPLLEADIRRAIGHAYMMLERNDSAKSEIERAAALRAPTGGTDYAKVLDSAALLEWQLARPDEAERLFRLGLANCGTDARGRGQRAEILNDFSALKSQLGQYEEALAMGEEALRLRHALPDTPPREIALGYANIATALDGLQRFDDAYVAYSEALRRQEAISPEPELDVSITLNNLAYLQNERGHTDEAIALQERSIALRRKVMGSDYPRLVAPLSNLAQQYAKVGRHDDAAAAMREALRLAPQAYPGGDDQLLGHLLTAAAIVAQARGDRAEAATQAKRAIEVYEHAEAVEPGRREKAQAILDAVGG